jgi:hypothetical protein
MLWNGSTAIDGFSGSGRRGCGASVTAEAVVVACSVSAWLVPQEERTTPVNW